MSQVILYSGGMDSHIAAHAFQDAKLLYIDSGARYTHKELMHIPQTCPRDYTVLRNVLDLSEFEREDAIVPARNLYLVALASMYGNQIILSATAGDNSTDKDQPFADLAGAVLTHIYDCKHFSDRKGETQVLLPFKDMSKRQMVEMYLSTGGDEESLLRTVSCYDGNTDTPHCGKCKACLRKWLALTACGISCDLLFHNNPRDYDWSEIVQACYEEGGWRCPDEDRYTLDIVSSL